MNKHNDFFPSLFTFGDDVHLIDIWVGKQSVGEESNCC